MHSVCEKEKWSVPLVIVEMSLIEAVVKATYNQLLNN